ncbi:6622_t:CDS:1, partial [Funneliformis caledonium]
PSVTFHDACFSTSLKGGLSFLALLFTPPTSTSLYEAISKDP